ncbi:MAG: peptidylprolyl isomerase, partial [Mailhella sp.]|nr:peptidylprolyl isomerase [Mailhella sp.]
NAMIDEILVRHAAQKNGITITPEQIDNEIKTRREEAGLSEEAFADLMKKQGMDDAKLRETVELSLMGQALVLREVFSKIVIPDSEIEQFYVQNGGVLTGPRIRIALIVYPDDETAGKMAKSAGKKLSNFNETAKEVSVGPNAEDGGDMGSMSLTDLAPAVRAAVTDVKAGKSTGIFSLEGQPAQAFVIERESGDNSGIDPEVRRNIENRLKSARVDEYLRTYLDQLREKALVTVR